MVEPINLNRARKARAKAVDKAQAAQNRVTHGRSRAERERQAAEQAAAARRLEGHRRDDDEPGG